MVKKITRVLPNAGSPSGGDTVTVYGYGSGASTGNLTGTTGGEAASVVNVNACEAVAFSPK